MENDLRSLKNELCMLYPSVPLVFSEGRIGAQVMLIGEAPGEKEEAEGHPFVGKAGKNLDEFLMQSGIQREELFVTNAVKLRPSKTGKSGKKVNRPPTETEVRAFRPFLLREIAIVRPKIVVTLGNVPLYAVTGEKTAIGLVHGKPQYFDQYVLYPMYHPASVIYNRSLRDSYLSDVKRLGEMIHSNG